MFPFLGENGMGKVLAAADVAITRGGALALAEIDSLGLKAVVIPYSYAAGEHQEGNARFLVEERRGVMIRELELGRRRLTEATRRLLVEERGERDDRGGGATEEIGKVVVELAKGNLQLEGGMV